MGEAARVANERIDTANRGKKMLDEGGPDVELKLRCKRQCRKTVEDDGKQVRALDQLARDYDDAISKLKASLTTEALQPEEKYDFEQLVGLYEERKAACERASAALANLPPPSPFISQEEEDAIRMLAVKDKYQVAQREASNLAADASAAARAATRRPRSFESVKTVRTHSPGSPEAAAPSRGTYPACCSPGSPSGLVALERDMGLPVAGGARRRRRRDARRRLVRRRVDGG